MALGRLLNRGAVISNQPVPTYSDAGIAGDSFTGKLVTYEQKEKS
jgi:hypothetical protein